MHIEILKEGGVTAPKGFRANGLHCGIRKNKEKKDFMLIVSDVPCDAAAVYTQNLVCGAPVTVTRENLKNGKAQAVICNSGIANTCNADGIEKAEAMCALVTQYTGIPAGDVVVASTGVIGQPIDLAPMQNGMQALVDGLSEHGSAAAAEAIMTTDTVKKEIAVRVALSGGKVCTLGAIAKGSGMIHPNMATMLSFITTDANIAPEMLKAALNWCVHRSYNMLSVDGDTSTNDTVAVLANGLCGNTRIETQNDDYAAFCRALFKVCNYMVRMLAKDGEGATKLVLCEVQNAPDEETARVLAKSVIRSPLVKTAMFGSDANWGRVLCALGYAGVRVDVHKIDVRFSSAKGEICVCTDGAGVDFSEEKAKEILSEDEITILVDLKAGEAEATAYGCDLTYDYVKINGDYRT